MRYMLLKYLTGGKETDTLYQIHNDRGDFIRFTDMDGNTIPQNTQFSATTVDSNATPPSWAKEEEIPIDPNALSPNFVPEILTKRQFIIALARSGLVPNEEIGTLPFSPPSFIRQLFSQLPTDDANDALLSWATMTQVERSSPLVMAAENLPGISKEWLDGFWMNAARF